MVKPMLLNEDDIVSDILFNKEKLIEYVNQKYPNWFFQIKYNGVRGVMSVKNNKITAIRDRTDNPILQFYPELKELDIPIKEGLLDIEVIRVVNEKSYFYNEYDKEKNLILGGIQLRNAKIKSDDVINNYPVSIAIFDILKLDGELLVNKPYEYRHNKLTELNLDNERIIVAKNYTNFSELWDKVVNEDLEGVVAKNPKGIYEIDTRSKNNIKIKNYKTIYINVKEKEKNNKGLRISGFTDDGLEVNFQFFGDSQVGDRIKIKYLERIGGYKGRLTQPTIIK